MVTAALAEPPRTAQTAKAAARVKDRCGFIGWGLGWLCGVLVLVAEWRFPTTIPARLACRPPGRNHFVKVPIAMFRLAERSYRCQGCHRSQCAWSSTCYSSRGGHCCHRPGGAVLARPVRCRQPMIAAAAAPAILVSAPIPRTPPRPRSMRPCWRRGTIGNRRRLPPAGCCRNRGRSTRTARRCPRGMARANHQSPAARCLYCVSI